MNRYALIKDSINDNIFGVVVDSNGLSKFYGVSAKGIEWSKWANGISVKSANDGLPAGIVIGEYSPLRNDSSVYVQALVDTVSLRNPSVNRKQGVADSLVKNSTSATPSVRDAELRAFDMDKRADAINFKARAFRTDSKVTSLLTQVRTEKLGFVSSEGAFSSRNPISIPEVKQAEIIDTYGRSIQRAIGKNLIRKKSAKMVTVVRAAKLTASGIEFKAAGLGPKIGSRLSGGLRSAPAGMSFVDVTGVTDADTDGIVFEGKPGLERPIIPRFIVPKDLARKLSGIVEGDAEAIEKQRRAGNTSVQFDEGKLRKIIESVGGDANLLTAVADDNGIPATTPSGRERLSVTAPKPSGVARNIARDAVIGGRVRSNQRPDLGDPTPLSPSEIKKLSPQELVDRLIEDRYAGLNLEEAAKKYGLKGGRAEARRLEAREMQRRNNQGMRSRTTPPGIVREDDFNFEEYDFNDQVADAMWNWLGRPDQQEMRERSGGLEALWEDFKKSDEYRDMEADMLDDNLKFSGATSDNPVLVSTAGNNRGQAEIKYDGEMFTVDVSLWNNEQDELFDTPEAKQEFDNLSEAEEYASSLFSDGMRSRNDYDSSLSRNGWRKNGDKWNKGNWELEVLVDENDRANRLVARNKKIGETLEQERGPDVGALKHLNVFESILRGSDDAGFDDDSGMRSRRYRNDDDSDYGDDDYGVDRGDWDDDLDPDERRRIMDGMRSRTEPLVEAERLNGNELSDAQQSQLDEAALDSRMLDLNTLNEGGIDYDRIMDALNYNFYNAQVDDELAQRIEDAIVERDKNYNRYMGKSYNRDYARTIIERWQDSVDDDPDKMGDLLSSYEGDLVAAMEDHYDDYLNGQLDTFENRRDGGMRSRTEWTPTRDGIEMDAPDIDGIYEIQGNNKEGFVVTRYSDGVRNGGQNQQEYEHDEIFKSRAAAKKWAERDYNDAVNAEQNEGRGMRSRSGINSRRDRNVFFNHVSPGGKDMDKWPNTATIQDVYSPKRDFYGAEDVSFSDRIILSAPSDGSGTEGKVYIAEIDRATGKITVRWGKADSRNLQEKTYSGKTDEDFFKLLRDKEKRGYRLEGGRVPAKYSSYDKDEYWTADYEKQMKMGMRSSAATTERPYYNVPVTGSSALRQASWDDNNNELIVTFANGRTYTYENVALDDLPDVLTGKYINDLKTKKSFREGGEHAFDPEYQGITGPGQQTGRGRLRRSGSGEKTQIPVSGSSAIEALTWDDQNKDLVVTYAGGRTYTYKDVDDYWVDELEDDLNGTGRIVNNIKKEGYRVVDGGEHGDMPSEGLTAERARFGMRSQSGIISGDRFLYQDDVSRVGRGGKTRVNIGDSRAVRAITWDDNNRDLIVTFGSGRTYTYLGVDDDLIKDLEENPDSVGKIVNKIKNSRVPYEEGGDHAPLSTLSSEIQQQREALGMRSRMSPSAGRIRAAEMEISARPQGMASRRSEGLRDPRYAVPGRDRVDPSDGQLWARLSDEDKKTVADRAVQREKYLLGEFKKKFPNWWRRANSEAEKNGWDKELMGGRNAGWLDELHRFVTKLSDDPNYPEKSRLEAERDFNDLQSLFNMRANRGQHDLLEHLNSTSRRYLFDDARRADGKTTKISSSGKEMKIASTAPRPFGEPVDTGNPIREQVGEKQKKPLKERLDAFYKRMSDKILYEDPARKQRREMRKARRQGINVGGFSQEEANPVDDAKRKIRKRKRLKEMRKYRSRDVESISNESKKNRVDGKLAHTGDSGEIVFGEKLVPTLSTMMENYRTSKKLKKTSGSTNKNKALAVLWDGAGYNGTPQIITPEEFKALHAAGWLPVVRGHGTGPNGVRYADDWIDSPIRFIPGQGGEAQGEGEYWARATQGGGGWFSWMDGTLPAGTVALLPPSTRRVSKNELRQIQSEHAPLAKAIKQFDAGLPEGEREKMSPEEYVSSLRDYLKSTLGPTFESTMSTRMGKMTSKILDSLSGSSGGDKKQLLDALEFLELVSKQRTVNSYAPLLGYDSIIADSGVELIHNRTAVAVVGDTFSRDDAVNLAKSKA